LLGSQATGLANAEYDLTVVSLASKDARSTSLPEQGHNPSRLVNKYLDSIAVTTCSTAQPATSRSTLLFSPLAA
jgi:hypothetical protein